MSRIGKQSILIPEQVAVSYAAGMLEVRGPKGTLSRLIPNTVAVTIADGAVGVDVANKDDKKERSLWGTTAAHIKNMIEGVTAGFQKKLEVNGVGYKVALQGTQLKLEVGFSHPVLFDLPKEVHASVEKNMITLESADKELLGQTAAEIRSIQKPEPYKGKGIKYADEHIRRKAGKTAKSSE